MKRNELSVNEAVTLAADDCHCLFTFEQLLDKLITIPGYEGHKVPGKAEAIRNAMNTFVNNKVWKKVGTTGGKMRVVYCTNANVVDIFQSDGASPTIKEVNKLDPDLSLEEVMKILQEYMKAQLGNEQSLSSQVHSLQGALQDKAQEITQLNDAHKKELDFAKERYQKLSGQIKALKEVV